MEYLFHILVLISIYTILAVSLDLIAGHTGLVSIAHASFYGLGAYTSALLAIRVGMPFPLGIAAGMVIAGLISFIISIPSLRLRDDYFILVTFSFQMILYNIFNNWTELTRGSLGIPGIPHPTFLGWSIQSRGAFVLLAFIFAAFTYAIVGLLTKSPFGRVLLAIREDEVFAQSLGKNTFHFKVTAFAISAAFAALAGSLYAHYITYIDPTSFTVMESILVMSMVIIGGAGSFWGPIIGAVTLVALPEVLRLVGLPDHMAANLRQVFYGVILVIILLVRPRGLVGRYGFGR
jgi:branched-chain amino acid transport system permease protein